MNSDPKCPRCLVLLLSTGKCARCGMQETRRMLPLGDTRLTRRWPDGNYETMVLPERIHAAPRHDTANVRV